ncbi:MAG: sialidase family protein [Planctomycetota bacterium]
MKRARYGLMMLAVLAVWTAAGYGETLTVAKSGKQPRVAIAPNGTICVVFGRGIEIYGSTSTNGGETYSEPAKVGEAPKLMCGVRRGPQVAATRDALVVTAIGEAGNIVCRRSEDWGRTWSDGAKVNDQDRSAREGLHAICAGAQNDVFAAWLDLRDNKTKLFGSLSKDGGKTWSKNTLIYESPGGTICQCCQPSVASDRKGTYYAMWRNALTGNRDMWMATSSDGKTFQRPQKLGAGSWPLEMCPMDGGAVAAGAGGKAVTVWRRDKQVYSCVSGAKEIAIGEGSQPQLAVTKDGVFKVWQQKGEVFCLRPGASAAVALGHGGYASVASDPAGSGPVIAVWEDHGGIVGAVVER